MFRKKLNCVTLTQSIPQKQLNFSGIAIVCVHLTQFKAQEKIQLKTVITSGRFGTSFRIGAIMLQVKQGQA